MKNLFSILLLLCTGFTVHAQNTLNGKITAKGTNELLAGATVYFTDLKKGTTTDENGMYVVRNLPEGKYLVEFKFLGYSSKVLKVDISGNTVLNIELDEAHIEIHELVVTGVSHATEVRQNPVPSSIVPKSVLLENSSSNLIDAIAKQPGISQVTTGAAVSKPVIRGLGYNRVITLNNGLRQEGQQWGDEHGIEIDEYSVDRTEIIKGPGSLMYGSDGMAGVINFIAPKPIDDGKITGNIQSNYQTNNGLIGNSVMLAGNSKGFDWMARASRKDARAYSNAYDGKVFNSGFNEFDYNAMIGLNRKWGYTYLTWSSFNQHVGMVEGERDSTGAFIKQIAVNDTTVDETIASSSDLNSYSLAVPKQFITHNRLASQSYFILGKSRLALNFSWQQNHRREYGNVLDPEEYELYFLLNTYTYDVKYFLPEMAGFETTIGLNGMQQSNSNKGEEFIIPEYSLFDYGLFAVTKKSIGKFSFSGGARFDQRFFNSQSLVVDSAEKFNTITRNFSTVAASLGATYALKEGLLLKLNVSRGFRAPNASELASNGKHEGTLRYEYGNSKLKAETSLQVDLGVNFSSEHLSVDVSLFRNSIQNFIYVQRISSALGGDSIVDVSDPVPTFQYTQGNAALTGGELFIDIHPHPLDWLHIENSFSYVQGVNQGKTDSAKYLPFIPPAHYQGELRANLGKHWKAFNNTYLKAQFDYYFAQKKVLLDNNTETPSQAYYLINAGAGTDVVSKKGNTLFSLYFSVNNLLNTAYQNHLSRIRYAAENAATGRVGVFNMGRNFSIKLVIPLSIKK
ncbi:MAG: TonB-dependent receptor [Bacteroidia bacterium]